ncbi:MAG: hypothetical protein R2810_04065 [Flavobacteriales bacterium]
MEDETLSCGTGVTAAALSYLGRSTDREGVAVKAPGGELRVEARASADGGFEHVFLSGPVRRVFTGEWEESDEGPALKRAVSAADGDR